MLGSPVGALIRRKDGSEYRSGTERELDLMLCAREASGGVRFFAWQGVLTAV
jgi:hypothetical protein